MMACGGVWTEDMRITTEFFGAAVALGDEGTSDARDAADF
jgi:hypothetical protein